MTYTYMHVLTHSHINVNSLTHIQISLSLCLSLSLSLSLSHTHTHTYTHNLFLSHTHIQSFSPSHMCMCTPTYTHTQSLSLSHRQTHTHTQTHTLTLTPTRSRLALTWWAPERTGPHTLSVSPPGPSASPPCAECCNPRFPHGPACRSLRPPSCTPRQSLSEPASARHDCRMPPESRAGPPGPSPADRLTTALIAVSLWQHQSSSMAENPQSKTMLNMNKRPEPNAGYNCLYLRIFRIVSNEIWEILIHYIAQISWITSFFPYFWIAASVGLAFTWSCVLINWCIFCF